MEKVTREPDAGPLRHSAVVRVTHWVMFLAFAALAVTGLEIVISHPRFYWGETGNVNMKPLFALPIPASRDSVPTGFGYTMPDQNGWSRYLHFEAAWVLLFTGAVYVVWGAGSGHFRRRLWPAPEQRRWRAYADRIGAYLSRHKRSSAERGYNVLQRTAYLVVIFGLFPLIIWTGLALSPAFDAVVPAAVNLLGGRQSARTLHFFVTWALLAFLAIHIAMVAASGFWKRMRAMTVGQPANATQQPEASVWPVAEEERA